MNTAEYLIKKLEELGIIDFFGLPGDYNFNILNAIESNPNTNWIGCSNELNAGYAADGYARENGYGALVTTYGVGELSALNSIAGSYSENVSVINIVGVPNTKSIINKTCSHHNFQEVEPFIYSEIFRNVTETVAFLNRDNAKLEIDRVLKVFVKERKPVYIAVPLDIATMDISEREADYSWSSSQDTLESLVNIIMDKINKSKNPMILGDVLIKRFSAELEYREFVEKSSFPTVNLLMGTNLIDSELKNNLGTFFSDYLNINAKKCLYESDCIISVGFICGTFNSFGEDLSKKIKSNIQISGTYTCVDGIKYENIKMSELLEKLSERVESREIEVEKTFVGYEKVVASDKKITSSYIYPRLQEFLKENDILVAETGIIPYGVAQIKFPKYSELLTQSLWASIGWATPATLGVCAAKPDRKVVLLTGEGSHQITAMELGTMLKNGLKPVVIVLNNKGYTIERLLSDDFNAQYNDISQMNYSKFARVFEGDIWSTRVETEDDFDKALKVSQIMNKLCYIEVVMDSNDFPELAGKVLSDMKNVTKNENSENISASESTKAFSKIHKGIMNFATKVHESLR